MTSMITLTVVLPVLVVAILLTLTRLIKGPNLPDRVVALDLLATIGISLIAAYAIATEEPAILDIAIVLALISFLGTIAFAYYIEQKI
ncbi:MAG: cation:proton antiporter [Anaerolineaceae bacterium]|nr:cation:proton antiporter [Anaerolineaceae bacterium]